MNYEVFINGTSTGRMVCNSPSEQDAKDVWERFNGKGEIELKPIQKDVPKMFSNCILDIE